MKNRDLLKKKATLTIWKEYKKAINESNNIILGLIITITKLSSLIGSQLP